MRTRAAGLHEMGIPAPYQESRLLVIEIGGAGFTTGR